MRSKIIFLVFLTIGASWNVANLFPEASMVGVTDVIFSIISVGVGLGIFFWYLVETWILDEKYYVK